MPLILHVPVAVVVIVVSLYTVADVIRFDNHMTAHRASTPFRINSRYASLIEGSATATCDIVPATHHGWHHYKRHGRCACYTTPSRAFRKTSYTPSASPRRFRRPSSAPRHFGTATAAGRCSPSSPAREEEEGRVGRKTASSDAAECRGTCAEEEGSRCGSRKGKFASDCGLHIEHNG
jgi:hypothetical protein